MAMTEAEQWAAYLAYAGALKEAGGDSPTPGGIKGRFITVLVNKLCEFWEKHKDTLIPALTQVAIAALEALVAQRANINTINQPGPR